ncbi:MAG: helix-turn-helix domain-containing protein [bacterium]|nr:helix-turn-helix domain-containing protein [bacterium]
MDDPKETTYLTAEQVAKLKQVSLSTVKRATSSGILKNDRIKTKKGQKRFARRYRLEDVLRWKSTTAFYIKHGGEEAANYSGGTLDDGEVRNYRPDTEVQVVVYQDGAFGFETKRLGDTPLYNKLHSQARPKAEDIDPNVMDWIDEARKS